MDQSDAGSAGIFSRCTNKAQEARAQEARVYSHDGPIRHRKRGYILTMDPSGAGSAGAGGAPSGPPRWSYLLRHNSLHPRTRDTRRERWNEPDDSLLDQPKGGGNLISSGSFKRPQGPHRQNMPHPLTRLVHIDRICPLPSPNWSTSTEYAPSPHPIGPHRQNMPPPLTRLVHIDKICPLPSPDWSASTEQAAFWLRIRSSVRLPFGHAARVERAGRFFRQCRRWDQLGEGRGNILSMWTNRVSGGGIFCRYGPTSAGSAAGGSSTLAQSYASLEYFHKDMRWWGSVLLTP
eukprot:1181342-Prorocentrum_minimum.AAC.5